jgi:hypothetical protein
MKSKCFVLSFLSAMMLSFCTAFAGDKEVTDTSYPIVPYEIFTQGRQKIVYHLLVTFDAVSSRIEGNSVINTWGSGQHHLTLGDMEYMGYKDRGSLEQLNLVLEKLPFDVDVVPVDNGYDLQVLVDLYSNGRTVLKGSAYPQVIEDDDGDLESPRAHAYVWLPHQIGVLLPYHVTEAKWVHDGREEGLGFNHTKEGTEVIMNERAISNGSLVFASDTGNGNIETRVLDFKTGVMKEGREVIIYLEELYSSEIIAVARRDINNVEANFHEYNGYVYGRFPILEVRVTQEIASIIDLEVPVWGTPDALKPNRVYVDVLRLDVPRGGPLSVGSTIELPWSDKYEGWYMNLPKGLYHIRLEFGIRDWSQDDGTKG